MAVATRGVLRRSPRLVALEKQQKAAALAVPKRKKAVRRTTSPKKTITRKKPSTAKTPKQARKQKQPSKKAATAAAAAAAASKKKKKKGTTATLSTTDAAPLGVIDPASGLTGSIETIDGAPADAMLVQVDPSKNMDKYYVLQCIERDNGEFVVYTRWGRTGTAGQSLHEPFETAPEAHALFGKKFTQKTGLSWTNRHKDAKNNKYRFIVQDFEQKRNGYSTATWQYYVDDGVDGKRVGWYDYTADGSIGVERLFSEHAQNPRLTSRHVTSGIFTYHVDLGNMTQTNVTHSAHTTRNIRRCVVKAKGKRKRS